jgi:hypothetical protein
VRGYIGVRRALDDPKAQLYIAPPYAEYFA